jgi:hypothetical protein
MRHAGAVDADAEQRGETRVVSHSTETRRVGERPASVERGDRVAHAGPDVRYHASGGTTQMNALRI